jgi:hypothetical protein
MDFVLGLGYSWFGGQGRMGLEGLLWIVLGVEWWA